MEASTDKKNPIFSGFFGSNFTKCRALGKAFAERPTKDTRQIRLCPPIFCRVAAFAECKLGFAECPWHSAKPLSPVVLGKDIKRTTHDLEVQK